MIKSILFFSLLSAASIAADNQNTAQCQAIKDASERLTCYDKMFPPTVAIDAKKIDLSKKTEEAKKQNTGIFGLEDRVTEVTPDKISSVAIGEFREWKRKMKVKLENGQVWRITSGNLYHIIKNPTVTISKGALGSHFLSVEGVNKRLKVKRIK